MAPQTGKSRPVWLWSLQSMFGVLIISAKLQSTFDCTPRAPDHQNRLADQWMNDQREHCCSGWYDSRQPLNYKHPHSCMNTRLLRHDTTGRICTPCRHGCTPWLFFTFELQQGEYVHLGSATSSDRRCRKYYWNCFIRLGL